MTFYTRCLQDLPRMTVNDVHRIVKTHAVASSSKKEKGFKMYISSYIDNYEDAPWMGSSPDGLVYDPTENPQYGLVEVKCPNVKSYVDCSYLEAKHGTLQLKHHHNYYWQIQGQMLITGMDWCDFVVFAEEDMLVQRILKDAE
ncbi:hypothetical protein NFI96_007229, partial [Prochilodus magdalenae]